jgi:polysaccharide chain length determinant protein (PEP-CTERM system associated)
LSTTVENASGVSGYLAILRRRRIYLMVIAPVFILGSVFFSFWLTPQFQSTATILLEPSSVDPKVVTTTVISYSNEQIEIVQGRVMTIETLQQLVKEDDPYPTEHLSVLEKAQKILDDTTLERVDPVTMKPLQESNAFSLHYRNTSKDRAKDVAKHLAQLFLTYNQTSREQAAQDAAGFLRKQAEEVGRQMRSIDDEIKTFKAAHGDALPELMQRNEASLDRNQHDLDNLAQEIQHAEERESLLAVQLSQTSPNMITEAGDATDLPTVRAKLAEAQQRYTPDHPEVKRLKQALAQLSAQQSQIAQNGIVLNANNPQYQTIASQLKSARSELTGLRTQQVRIRAQSAEYEAFLRKTPGVEREYSEIMRRRNSLQDTYQQIQTKLQNALVAQSFESEQGGERFTMIRSPARAKLPVYPNRIGFILLGVVLGLGLSGLAMVMAESSGTALRSAQDFPAFGDAELLATIPLIETSKDRRRRRIAFASWAVAYSVAILAVGVVVSAAS